MILVKKYSESEHPPYDNYDAVNVDVTANIPYDYNGVMGVPITFWMDIAGSNLELLGSSGIQRPRSTWSMEDWL